MQLHTLESKERQTGRKGITSQVRADGSIPSILYGEGAENMNIMVNRRSLEKIMHSEGGAHALIQLEFGEKPQDNTPVIIKAIQRHPVSDAVLHVDFLRINLDKKIQSPVTVVLTGRPKGVIEGGVIDVQLREILVECLALDMPDHVEIDISNLEMGESVHVADLNVSDKVEILTDAEYAIASIHMPRVLKAAEEVEAEGEGTEEPAEEAE